MPSDPEKHDDQVAIRFPDWSDALERAALPEVVRQRHRGAILGFLRHCKVQRVPVSVALMRTYVEGSGDHADRLALRWFYQASRSATTARSAGEPKPTGGTPVPLRVAGPANEIRTGGESDGAAGKPTQSSRPDPQMRGDPTPRVTGLRSDVPPAAVSDQGGADWERDLVAAVRSKGFLWRTEETYRAWAARFAQFLRPKSPYAATAGDVGAFLTALAVKQRAMPSTQKQALNALVFLLQEALHRQLGEIPFQRATPRRRMPTVLTRDECARLFGELTGTTRLMAELMYGSGLRLFELLRLRVHHVDLARQQLKLCGAKGDRVNGFANAAA